MDTTLKSEHVQSLQNPSTSILKAGIGSFGDPVQQILLTVCCCTAAPSLFISGVWTVLRSHHIIVITKCVQLPRVSHEQQQTNDEHVAVKLAC